MKYKRYMVFGFDAYYPSGGLGDCFESFDTIEEVKARFTKDRFNDASHVENKSDYFQILDRITGEEVEI